MNLLRRDAKTDDVSLLNIRLSAGSSDQFDTCAFHVKEPVRAQIFDYLDIAAGPAPSSGVH
jgi:hypothetical protein